VGDTKDAIVIAAIVIINAIVGFVQEYKAERALESLKRMASPLATVFRDGDVEHVPTETVVPAISSCWRRATLSPRIFAWSKKSGSKRTRRC
jgi:hypothetical protein